MNANIRFWLLAILFPVLLAACSNNPQQAPVQVSSSGSNFIIKAAEDHMTAIQLGRYASGQASDQRLKNYGMQMIRFHKAAFERAERIATAKNITLKDTMDKSYRQLITDLAQKAGNRFDSSFMSVMAEREK